ncbi:MAG TPA: nucleotidyltransferase family protein [Bryobacteraceae bacterium]|nr:nucleotidyltransferase family protein [Bryobacteraceae bacterium]
MSVAAIILAAGESRRMGQPKALLPFRNGSFLSVLAETLSVHCSPVCAVFGADAQYLMSFTPLSVVAAENPNYAQGMLTSLQAGLRNFAALPDRVLFTLVDHPAVSPATIGALLDSTAAIAIPKFGGKRGHPVVIRRAIAEEILAEPATSKLNTIMDRHASDIHYLDLEDSGITDDIDDPEAYRSLLTREGAAA